MAGKKSQKQKGKKSGDSKKNTKPVAKSPVAKRGKKETKDSAACSGRSSVSDSGKGKRADVEKNKDNVVHLPMERKFSAAMIPRADEVLEELLNLNKRRRKIEMRQAKLLYEVQINQYYTHYKDGKGKPFKTFESFVHIKMKVDIRKAYALKRIWAKLHIEGGVAAKELEQIPWTKAELIASEGTTPEEVEEWKSKAEQMPYNALKSAVTKNRKKRRQELLGKVDSGPAEEEDTKPKEQEKWERLLVYLSEDQNELVQAAIRTAEPRAKSDKTNVIISLICQEWLAYYSKHKSDRQRLAALLARLSDSSDFEIFAFPKKAKSMSAKKKLVNEILDQVYDLFGITAHITDEEET